MFDYFKILSAVLLCLIVGLNTEAQTTFENDELSLYQSRIFPKRYVFLSKQNGLTQKSTGRFYYQIKGDDNYYRIGFHGRKLRPLFKDCEGCNIYLNKYRNNRIMSFNSVVLTTVSSSLWSFFFIENVINGHAIGKAAIGRLNVGLSFGGLVLSSIGIGYFANNAQNALVDSGLVYNGHMPQYKKSKKIPRMELGMQQINLPHYQNESYAALSLKLSLNR